MPLTDNDIQQVQDWLQETGRNKNHNCPWCGSNGWIPQKELIFPVTIDGQTGRINHLAGIPMVGVICKECAYIMLFSAKRIGVANT